MLPRNMRLPAHVARVFDPFNPVAACHPAEKAFVTGVEAANGVVKHLGVGKASEIIPLEDDEPHIKVLRSANQRLKRALSRLPGAGRLIP